MIWISRAVAEGPKTASVRCGSRLPRRGLRSCIRGRIARAAAGDAGEGEDRVGGGVAG
jgi:hypothetical protein